MITPSFGLTATERVLPKLALDFTTASLDPRVTFTRTTDATHPATYVNSSGVVTSATNNQPRFDYNPVTLACKGLLIEESRTNSFVYSADLSNANWLTSNTSTGSTTASPDGTNTAYKMVPQGGGEHYRYQSLASGTHTISCYAKASGYNWICLFIQNGSTASAYFNLSTGVVGTVSGTSATKVASIQDAGNGWYRCVFTATAASSGAMGYLFTNADATTIFTADGTSGMYVWGAQIELNTSFATSYIPTTSAALTRNADVATMTGTNFSSWWTATTGGAQVTAIPKSNATTKPYLTFDDSTALNNILMQSNTTNLELKITNLGVLQTTLDSGTVTVNSINKICCAWSTNSCASSGNAANPATIGLAVIPTPTQLRIGSDGTNYANAWIQKISYWKQRIINAETQAFSK